MGVSQTMLQFLMRRLRKFFFCVMPWVYFLFLSFPIPPLYLTYLPFTPLSYAGQMFTYGPLEFTSTNGLSL